MARTHQLPEEPLENDFIYETDEGFNAFMHKQMDRAPWSMISIGIHAILIALCLLIPWESPAKPVKQIFYATLDQETPEEPIDEDDEWEEEKELNPELEPTENPVEKENAIQDNITESDNDQDFNQDLGNSEVAMSEQDLNFDSTQTHMGFGGGPAGDFGSRRGGKANKVAINGGKGTQSAVASGLKWLRDHQNSNGSWSTRSFFSRCGKSHGRNGRCSGVGNGPYDPGNTGLALLAFLGAGHTHHQKGPYQSTVKKGLKYLKSIQDAEGCFGPRKGHFMYNHTIAALAITEAYGLTQSFTLRACAQLGIEFLAKAQNPYLAWRYIVQPVNNPNAKPPHYNDSSVTGWVVMVLKSAKIAGLEVPHECFEGARDWFDSVTDEQYYRTGYVVKGDRGARLKSQIGIFGHSESMTAVAVMSRVFMGMERHDPRVRGGAELLLQSLPEWSTDHGTSKIDYYYWYYGTLAMFQMGGDYWKSWNVRMKKAIVELQNVDKGTCLHGSWDPVGAWGSIGGRVYATAINVLSLEIYYRYDRVFR
ncbi:MAG: terpene cyclase/mutase family protein [Planctomycetota bacterium]|jgi:hypothetical protein|nr:terpene cyclase/mutase family protein [Planctomycetota bacterium]